MSKKKTIETDQPWKTFIDYVKARAVFFGFNNNQGDGNGGNGCARNFETKETPNWFGFIREDQYGSSQYEGLSFVIFPSHNPVKKQCLVTIGIGRGNVGQDAELAANPAFRRSFMRLCGNDKSAAQFFFKVHFDNLDISTPNLQEIITSGGFDNVLAEQVTNYNANEDSGEPGLLPAAMLINDYETDGAQKLIVGWLAQYAKWRNWHKYKGGTDKIIVAQKIEEAINAVTTDRSADYSTDRLFSSLIKNKYIVLQGAPGCGKTWSANEIANEKFVFDSKDSTKSNVFFTQFHAETTYADFVYGIKPVLNRVNVAYKGEKGILLRAIEKANDMGPYITLSTLAKECKKLQELSKRSDIASCLTDISNLLQKISDGLKKLKNQNAAKKAIEKAKEAVNAANTAAEEAKQAVEKAKEAVNAANTAAEEAKQAVKESANKAVIATKEATNASSSANVALEKARGAISSAMDTIVAAQDKEKKTKTSENSENQDTTEVAAEDTNISSETEANANTHDVAETTPENIVESVNVMKSATREMAKTAEEMAKTTEEMAKTTEEMAKPYRVLLIIDEINRANLANVLGPVFYLFEPNAKDRNYKLLLGEEIDGQNKEVKLEYDSIPDNLYVIATMNTADRSIAVVDFALRRRFAWITLRPHKLNASPYKNFDEELYTKIDDIFVQHATDFELNLQPGQSYFLDKDMRYDNIVYGLMPLMKEYFSEGFMLSAKDEICQLFYLETGISMYE